MRDNYFTLSAPPPKKTTVLKDEEACLGSGLSRPIPGMPAYRRHNILLNFLRPATMAPVECNDGAYGIKAEKAGPAAADVTWLIT